MSYVVLKDVNGHVATFDQEDMAKEVEKMVGVPMPTIQVFIQAFGPANLNILQDPAAIREWLDKAIEVLEPDPDSDGDG